MEDVNENTKENIETTWRYKNVNSWTSGMTFGVGAQKDFTSADTLTRKEAERMKNSWNDRVVWENVSLWQ